MKILEITSQNRRDFCAILACEACGNKQELNTGYDDHFYHANVIPSIRCTECHKSRNDIGAENPAITTRYPEGFQV